jgi:undecaprenyl diphosphate synthase
MQSTRQDAASGLHVAIVMDGNGRWATARGLPRRRGHEAGARTVRAIVEAAPPLGIGLLTLYAFSADNWKRPRREVGALLALFRGYLDSECGRLREAGIRLSIIGRRDRLPESLRAAVERAEMRSSPPLPAPSMPAAR